jgi:tricarboxylate carrier
MLTQTEIAELRKLQTIVNASIHPDTNKPVPWVMRMCAFVPTNLPIIFGMLMSPPTPFNTMFYQWLNQTYNAGMNYGNRNASSPQTVGDIAFGYSAAVLSSIAISLGLRKVFASATRSMTGGTLVLANSLINYVAVASAGFLNSYCMRMGEMKRGITITDENGEDMGISKKSAEKAVIQTSASRLILSAPTFIIPGLAMFMLDKAGLIPRARVPKTILDLTVISLALYLALPISVSMFPQRGVISAKEIEEEFVGKRNSRGEEVHTYYYNKGL